MVTLDEAIKRYINSAEYERTHENLQGFLEFKQLAGWLRDYKRLLEREAVLDKIRAEIIDTLYVDSLIFGELIDFKNGKISADDVIEEFNRVTRIEVLKIIDKYKAESEVQNEV
jgi:predicted CopG family antitoxin